MAPTPTREAEHDQKRRVDAYLTKRLPLVRDHGFPGISMEPIYRDGVWSILVSGDVVGSSERATQDNQLILGLLLPATEPPVPLEMEVRFLTREKAERSEGSGVIGRRRSIK